MPRSEITSFHISGGVDRCCFLSAVSYVIALFEYCFLGPFLSKDFLPKFPDIFFTQFLYFHIFLFFFPSVGALKIFCPLLNFQFLETFPVLPAFSFFRGKKKEDNLGKKCSIRTSGPYTHVPICLNNLILIFSTHYF